MFLQEKSIQKRKEVKKWQKAKAANRAQPETNQGKDAIMLLISNLESL
jgi:hypothetical protein